MSKKEAVAFLDDTQSLILDANKRIDILLRGHDADPRPYVEGAMRKFFLAGFVYPTSGKIGGGYWIDTFEALMETLQMMPTYLSSKRGLREVKGSLMRAEHELISLRGFVELGYDPSWDD